VIEMAVVGVLLLFSAAGAWMCVKARAAGPAAVFAAFAVLLFVATPVGSGLPHAIGVLFSVVNDSTTPAPQQRRHLSGQADQG
jgi:hypothetical protein